MLSQKKLSLLSVIIFLAGSMGAQPPAADTTAHVTIAAGTTYQRTKVGRWLWGKNRRPEWATPVQVRVVLLDTVYGGLTPYKKSGGGESKSLRLKSASGKIYALRSIDKQRGRDLQWFLRNSPFGGMTRDGVSMSHPYAAFALYPMLQAANIHHTRPRLVYIPGQAALASFNEDFANDLYLLEERVEGDWKEAPHLGGYSAYRTTAEVKEALQKDNRLKADQRMFIRARLFDILISDVDRHAGNWSWGVADTGVAVFKPVPVDRDQAFFTHNGLLTGISLLLTRRRSLQNFGYRVKNVKTLTSHDRMLDHFFTTEMTDNDWKAAAAELQRSLTDSVITVSIQQMPTEAFAVSGREITEKLKRRRDNLQKDAARYYRVLAKSVDVNGTAEKEYFEVKKGEGKTVISVYRVNTQGEKEAAPYYRRVFDAAETERINIFGFGGDDVFEVDKEVRGIEVRLEKGVNKRQLPDHDD